MLTEQDLLELAAAHCTEQGDCFIFSGRELLTFAAALAREQAAQPARYWSIADDANKCIHKPHCLATSKEMQALRLKAFAAAQPAAQEPSDEQIKAGVRAFQSGHNGFDDLSDWRAFYRTVAALAAQPAAQQPAAFMYQHDETGQVGFVDVQQVEWGFWKNNPRLREIGPLYLAQPAVQAPKP